MDSQVEKVYVALGNDLQDGFKTLDWTLRKWKSNPISIVILHVTCSNISSWDFVYTPFGKLPASSVSDEKLEVLRKFEEEKVDKLLSKYVTFCGKIKADILKVEKSDETIHKFIVDLISTHRITKLVMGFTFLKSSSSWRSKNAISGSFYIHQHKPNFCEFFIICGGKLVFLKEENEEGFMEDDQGVMVAKKASFRNWLGKMFTDNSHDHSHLQLSASSKTIRTENQWENYAQEIENYFEHLLSLNLDEETFKEENDILQAGSLQPDEAEDAVSTMVMTVAAKMTSMRRKLEEAQKMIQKKREGSKVNSEQCAKAEWATCLCNSRAEELEAKIEDEVLNRIDLSKSLDAENEQIEEIRRDIQESKNRLSSLIELQSELSSKLQRSNMARSHVELQLEKAVIARAETVREIEELRRQRDIIQRRIEFCKEKDAIGMVSKLNELNCGYREYSADDIRSATDDFSESLRLKSGGDWTNLYRGRINHMTVAIKMLNSDDGLSQEAFLAKVKALNNVRHQHLVAIIGFCSDPKCIIFEYMHNGSLRDILLSSSQRNHRKRNRAFRWNDRIRVAHEICSGLGFLHSARPRPLSHGHLTASKVLLDRNLVAKICGFRLTQSSDENETLPNIQAFGVLLFQLLTGRNWTGLVEEAMAMDQTALLRVLDERAGQWPLDLARKLVGIAMRCLECNGDLSLAKTREELEEIRREADDIVAKRGCECDGAVNGSIDEREDSSEAPSIFLCPILQEVMKNPHVAADGFSYELEAIEEWLNMGRDTSPMTNLKLKQRFLTPNHTLRSLIQEWNRRQSSTS